MAWFRTEWCPSMLSPGFERTLIGFDLRRKSSLPVVFMTDYDEQVRYEDQGIYETLFDDTGGDPLFSTRPKTVPWLNIPEDAVELAFDLPTQYVDFISQGIVCVPNILPWSEIDSNWVFAGFDVVDPIPGESAFYVMTKDTFNLQNFSETHHVSLNEHGLLTNDSDALRITDIFSEMIKSHAAFVPCGVWLHS